jgi:putative Mg2+ transporter-C (MgtC) family protein
MTLLEIFDIEPYQWSSILTSILCGGIIGLERQVKGKPVGIRTASLITLGTYLFLTTAYLLKGQIIDPSRVVGQVITGIGFLGAGVMLAKEGGIIGVTSAATIWVLAAIGVMISSNYLLPAIKLSLIVIIILAGIDFLEKHIEMLGRGIYSSVRSSFKKSEPDS